MVASMSLSVSGGTVGAQSDSRSTFRKPSDLGSYFQRPSGAAEQAADRAFAFEPEPAAADPAPKVRRAIRLVIGGYDTNEVDRLLSLAERAVANGGEVQRALARQELRMAELNRRVVGYARDSVHCLVAELGRQLGTG
jgi:hypothetical protein